MRRWFAFLAGFIIVLGLAVFLAAGSQPALRFALAQAKAAGFEVDAKSLRGNLFLGLEATDASLKSAFINGTGASVRAKYNLWNLLQKRELRLEAAVSGGRLSFDPTGLPPVIVGGEPAPISVFLDKAELTDTQVRFIGKNLFIPDAKITLLSQTPLPSQNGRIRGNLRVKLESKDGAGFATALYEFGKDFDANLVIDAELDAKIANYWLKPIPMAIQSGKLRGTVRVTGANLSAEATLQNGSLEVLPGLSATGLAGRASFDGLVVKANLTGQGLGGSLEADFSLDTRPKREQWEVTGKLRPRLEQIMKTFANGTPGRGALEVTVTGGGWEKIRLSGTAKGLQALEAAGFPIENFQATWQLTDRLTAQATAFTRVGADRLKAVADLKTIGQRVLIEAALTGNFLNAPLALNGLIEALGDKVSIEASGTGLGGAVNAKIGLKGEKISGSGKLTKVQLPLPSPVTSSLDTSANISGTVNNFAITGYLSPAQIKIPAVSLTDISGAYKLRFNGQALTLEANLADGAVVASGALVNTDGKPARGQVSLRGVGFTPGGKADYQAQYVINSAGVALSGVARAYDLNFAEARLDNLSGVLSLSIGQQLRGRWNANYLLATLTEKSLNLRPRAWRVQAAGETAFVAGDMTLSYAGLKTTGKLEGKTRFGTITALGAGSEITLSGNAGYSGLRAALKGSLRLEPFALRLVAVPQNKNLGGRILLEASKDFRVSGNLVSNGQNLEIGYGNLGLTAQGKLDLTALAPLLPRGSQNLIAGLADFKLKNSSGTAQIDGTVAGIPIVAQLRSNNLRLIAQATVSTGQFAGAKLSGDVFPGLNARLVYGGITARVSGAYDNILMAGAGKIPDRLLAGTGLSLANNNFKLTGRIQNGQITASGNLGGLQIQNARLENGLVRAGFSGDLTGAYQNAPLRLQNLQGQLEQTPTGLVLSTRATNATGVFSGNSIRASGLQAKLEQKNGANNLSLTASSAVVKTPLGVLLASGLKAVGDQKQLAVSAAWLEATGFEAKARLERILGNISLGKVLGFAVNFKAGNLNHPQVTANLGAGQVSGKLQGQSLETVFDLPKITASSRGESANLAAQGNLAINLEQPLQDWRGWLSAKAIGQDWRLGATGNWQNLRLSGNLPSRLSSLAGVGLPFKSNLAVSGTLGLPDLRYSLGVISKLPNQQHPLQINLSLKGQSRQLNARLEAKSLNGTGKISYTSSGTALAEFKNLDLTSLTATQTTISGQLGLDGLALRGKLNGQVAGLPVTATWLENGAFSGTVGGSLPIKLSADKWRFPLDTILALETEPSQLPLRGTARFNLGALRGQGQLELLEYSQNLGGGNVAIQPQVMPFQVSLNNGLRLRLENAAGALRLDKTWSGSLGLAYRAFEQNGVATARVSGALDKPNLILETTGLLQLRGSGNLENASLNGRLALQPLLGMLPKELQTGLVAGTAQLEATWKNDTLTFKTKLENTQFERQAVRLNLSGRLKNSTWSAKGEVAVGTSRSSFEASETGIRAPKLDLDLRLARLLGLDLNGRILGQLELPKYQLGQLEADLKIQKATGFGVSADGFFQASQGKIVTDLRGQTPLNLEYSLIGAVYPNLNLALQLGQLKGQVLGSRLEFTDRNLSLALAGRYLEKSTSLKAEIKGDQVRAEATWDAAQLEASGEISNLKALGTVKIADLQGLAGVAGSASAKLEYNNSVLSISSILAKAAGFEATGSAKFAAGILSFEQLKLIGEDIEALGSGQILPKLELTGSAKTTFDFAPTALTWRATGSLEQPNVFANGKLLAAKLGLIAPDTTIEAQFNGKSWRLQLSGEALSGVAEGGLSFVSSANFRVAAPIIFEDNRLNAKGNLAWNTQNGFSGGLGILGQLFGQAGELKIIGKQELEVNSTWRDLKLRATLPSQIGAELEAKLELERLDLGALYGKPKAIFLEGSGLASGQWANPELVFTGLLVSADTLLDAELQLQYGKGKADFNLMGKNLRGNGTWANGTWQAVAELKKIALEPYVPLPKELEQPIVSGALTASGNATIWQVSSNFDATAQVAMVGAVRLTGSAKLMPERLQTALQLEALGGNSRLQVEVQNPLETEKAIILLKADLQKIDVTKLKDLQLRGLVSGGLTIKGKLLDPNVNADLTLEKVGLSSQDWSVSSNLQASGRLLNPSLSGKAVLSGSGAGSFDWVTSEVLSDAPKILWDGSAKIPLGSAQGRLEGALPNLAGKLELVIPQLPETIEIIASGDGTYQVSSSNFANGTVKLKTQNSWLEGALTGLIRVKTNTDIFVQGVSASVLGDVRLAGTVQNPLVSLEETRLIRADGTVLAAGSVYPKLDLRGTAESQLEFAPAKLEYRLAGSFEKPKLEVSGVLGTAQVGLIAPNTQLQASFDGAKWRLNLRGEAISGVLEGDLSSLARVELALNAPILYNDTSLTALGNLAWDNNLGFAGSLNLQGQLFGQNTKLELVGQNQLLAKLNWKNGVLRASLPSPTSEKLVASWDFERFDLGAWWQKPDQLWIAGAGKATGRWINPELVFDGRLESLDGSLDSSLNASYLAGLIKAKLSGAKTKIEGQYKNEVWNAKGSLEKVVLNALPTNLVKELETSLNFVASGNPQGLEISLTKLEAKGKLETIGEFSASATAIKTDLEARLEVNNLAVMALGGQAKLDGQLAGQLQLGLEKLNLEPLGLQGLVSGNFDLTGKLFNPSVSGNLQASGLGLANQKWSVDSELEVSRELFNPALSGTLLFKGTGSGKVAIKASELFSSRPNLVLDGAVQLPFLSAKGNLAGRFPDLLGLLEITLPTAPLALRQVQLEGIGKNQFRVVVQKVLQGQLELTSAKTLLETGLGGEFSVNAPLETSLAGLVAGADGNLQGQGQISGTLQAPKVSLIGSLKSAGLAGVQLGNASLKANYDGNISAFLDFEGGQLKLESDRLTASNLPLEVAGIRAAVNISGRTAPFDLNFSGLVSGLATGSLEGRLVGEQLGLKLDLNSSGVRLTGTANASPNNGWGGQINLFGLPKAAPISGKTLTGTAQFALSGAFAAPRIAGTGDVYGAKFAVGGSLSPLSANLELLEAGSGSLRLEDNSLFGTIIYQDQALKLELTASGSLSIPGADFKFGVGQLRADGKVRLENNAVSAAFDLTDGNQKGRFRFEDGRIIGEVKNLSLDSSGLAGYAGTLDLEADLRQDPSSDFGWQGRAAAVWKNLKTPLEIPTLGWKIDGSGRATLSTKPVRVLLEYAGTPGVASGDLEFQKGLWQGDVLVDLRGAEGKGAVKGKIRADQKGFTGDLTAQNLPLAFEGIRATVSGKVDLTGDSFRLDGKGAALGGDVKLSGGGGLSDLLPLLESYTKTQPGDLPINLTANLFTVRLQDLAQVRAVAPYLRGRVNGTLKIVDDITNFELTQSEISLPDQNGKRITLAARIKGTLAGNLINYSGSFLDTLNPNPNLSALSLAGIGESRFTGRFNGKVATGTLELSRAPLHAFVASVLGEMPGTALATGFARYEIPINNLLAATVKMDFVPLEISGGGDTLTGKGRLIYSNGNLQFDNLILRGKGEWRINGDYAKEKVDLAMSFKDTVFTPILDLLPSIKDYDPRATGSLDLQLSGKYGAPNAKVSLKNLTASISGIQLTAKELLGSLENGALEVRGVLTSDDSLGATLDTTAKAKLTSYTPIQLEDLEALATGSLNIRPIGLIRAIKARAYGDSGGFKLDLTAQKGGDLSLRGDISPRIQLKLEGKALVMPIPDYFVADSLLDAILTFEGDGGRFYNVGGQLNIARLQTQLQQNSSPVAPKPSSDAKPNPFLQQVRFRGIEVIAPQGIRISESFSTLEAGGKLVITGTMANPELSGALEAVGGSGGRGTVRLGINNYTIQTAMAGFSPIEGIYPSIEIKSKGEVKASCTTLSTPITSTVLAIPIDLIIRVRWLSDSKNPSLKRIDVQPTVTGNCPDNGNFRQLTPAELYSLVTLGSSNANLGGLAQQSLDTVLSVFILGELTRQIKAATGIDIDFRSNLIEVVAQNITDPATQAVINFTLNFGIDLSRAVRLNVQINNNRIYTDPENPDKPSQLLGGAINLNWQSDDGRFGIRFGTPFFLPDPKQQLNVFDVIQPEAQFSFNLSNAWAISTTLGIPAGNNFRVTFGVSFRF